MTPESSKTLGGIGAILLFVGVFPFINYFGIVDLIGAILVLIGLHGLSEYYHDHRIFTDALWGVIIAIVGAIIAGVVGFFVVYSNVKQLLYQIYPGWNGDWSTLQSMTPNTTNIDPNTIIPLLVDILVIFVIVWVFAIVAAFFVRRSLRHVTERSNVGLFSTAGILLLIGAVLIIAFGLGLVLIWIAALILAIAFFTLKPALPEPVAAPPPPQETTTTI